ncbi:DUF6427 family protein [Polaribacter marinus]|uniref:DUF6427 family protein n=1 Tax=Polaribacter marinus TaxID=2916838 RepID=UPI003B84A7E2
MLANFLNKSKPINFIVLLSLFFLGFCRVSFSTVLAGSFSLDKLLNSCLYLGILLSLFFFYNFIVSKNNLTYDNSYAFFFFTILLSCILPEILSSNVLILILLHFLLLRKIYSFHSSRKIIQKLFDSGFWLGVSFIIDPYFLIFGVLIFSAIFLYQKITITTLLTPVIGFITPVILYFSYCFWYDNTEDFIALFTFKIDFTEEFLIKSKYTWLLLIIFTLTFMSVLIKTPKALSVNNIFKKSWLLLIFHLLITTVFFIILGSNNEDKIAFLIFPVSVILANGLELIKNNLFKNSVIYMLLLSFILCTFFL